MPACAGGSRATPPPPPPVQSSRSCAKQRSQSRPTRARGFIGGGWWAAWCSGWRGQQKATQRRLQKELLRCGCCWRTLTSWRSSKKLSLPASVRVVRRWASVGGNCTHRPLLLTTPPPAGPLEAQAHTRGALLAAPAQRGVRALATAGATSPAEARASACSRAVIEALYARLESLDSGHSGYYRDAVATAATAADNAAAAAAAAAAEA